MARLLWLAALGFTLAAANPWGSDTSREFAKKAFEKRSHGDYAGAFEIYQIGLRQAVEAHNAKAQIKFLNSLGGCRFVQFQFQPALKFWLEARELASTHPEEAEEHGAILFNLASL